MQLLEPSSDRARAIRSSHLFVPRAGHDKARGSLHVKGPRFASHTRPDLLDCSINVIGDFLRRLQFKKRFPRLHNKVRHRFSRIFVRSDRQPCRSLPLRWSRVSQRIASPENSSNIAPRQSPVVDVRTDCFSDQLELLIDRLAFNDFSLKPIAPKNLWSFSLAESLNGKCQRHERTQTDPIAARATLLPNLAKTSGCMPKHGKRLEVPLNRDSDFFFHHFSIELRDQSMREVVHGAA